MDGKHVIKILKEEKSRESDDRKIDAFNVGIEAIEKLYMIGDVLSTENENWIGCDYMDSFEQIKRILKQDL